MNGTLNVKPTAYNFVIIMSDQLHCSILSYICF